MPPTEAQTTGKMQARRATTPTGDTATSPLHTPHGHLPASPRRRLQGGNDARAPPPPNPWILGFRPGIGGGRRGVSLSVASKEEDGVQDVADAVTDHAGQGFLPARAPSTAIPTPQGSGGGSRGTTRNSGGRRATIRVRTTTAPSSPTRPRGTGFRIGARFPPPGHRHRPPPRAAAPASEPP